MFLLHVTMFYAILCETASYIAVFHCLALDYSMLCYTMLLFRYSEPLGQFQHNMSSSWHSVSFELTGLGERDEGHSVERFWDTGPFRPGAFAF